MYNISTESEGWVASRVATAWIENVVASQELGPKAHGRIKAVAHWEGTARLAASFGVASTETALTMDMMRNVATWSAHIPAPFTKDRRRFMDVAIESTRKLLFG
jgi:hypothetical protein